MELRDALIKQSPSLQLQRAALAEIARLDAYVIELEMMVRLGQVSKLPPVAYIDNSWNKSPGAPPVIAVKRGESGYYPIFTNCTADELNERLGVTPAQRQAMHVGSMCGWHCPGADPATYEAEAAA